MELKVLDKNVNPLYILENFESLIWTIRFNSFGDFETSCMLIPYI